MPYFKYSIPMFGFLIKKAFFDYWDNFIGMTFLNFGYIISALISILLSYLFVNVLVLPDLVKMILVIVSWIFVMNTFSGALYLTTRDIADYKQPAFKDFFIYLGKSLPTSLLFSAIVSALVLIYNFSYGFWASMNSLVAYAASVFLMCAGIIIIVACQYFFPIYAGLEKNFFKIIKKMFLIFLDNPFYSFALFFFSILIPVISVITLFMIPGFASVSLFLNVGLKLRLRKYDYLEENPDANPNKIPWDRLLEEDRERVGKRTLKGMIFPWKE